METYYAKRAAEYEKIYHKPERQADLARLRDELPALFAGKRVLEIACGTGYWTPLIAARAESVVALDYNEETLQIARSKAYPKKNVSFQQGDAYALPGWPAKFGGCFAGFWWSHVPLARLDGFLEALNRHLEPGATVAFLDNRYVEGSSTPVTELEMVICNPSKIQAAPSPATIRVWKGDQPSRSSRAGMVDRIGTACSIVMTASLRLCPRLLC